MPATAVGSRKSACTAEAEIAVAERKYTVLTGLEITRCHLNREDQLMSLPRCFNDLALTDYDQFSVIAKTPRWPVL